MELNDRAAAELRARFKVLEDDMTRDYSLNTPTTIETADML